MRRQGYRYGVTWIAGNDNDACFDQEEIAQSISVLLLAELFGKEAEDVAHDVLMKRRALAERERS